MVYSSKSLRFSHYCCAALLIWTPPILSAFLARVFGRLINYFKFPSEFQSALWFCLFPSRKKGLDTVYAFWRPWRTVIKEGTFCYNAPRLYSCPLQYSRSSHVVSSQIHPDNKCSISSVFFTSEASWWHEGPSLQGVCKGHRCEVVPITIRTRVEAPGFLVESQRHCLALCSTHPQ